jgi:hypothetical protein
MDNFICTVCGESKPYKKLAHAGNSSQVCSFCESKNRIDKLTEEEIREYLELDIMLSQHASMGRFYSEKRGEYVEYVSVFGARVTDPKILKTIKRKYEIMFPDRFDAFGFDSEESP